MNVSHQQSTSINSSMLKHSALSLSTKAFTVCNVAKPRCLTVGLTIILV